jgi:serine/threonine protein kinase/tetratricopeptide (TPR) repeat protein
VALAPGTRLGPYEVIAQIGAGGMGEVYKAFDPQLHREVAIKVAADRFSERFDREVRAVATLNHPNICTLHAVGPNYLVMELVEGETLREWLRRAPPLERSLEIARQILRALAAAHRAGIVHRDLKPENVMVRFDGYVKVLDFGLATRMPAVRWRLSGSSADTQVTSVTALTRDSDSPPVSGPGLLGTVPYMSPEQIQGHHVDQRSDLFAFGIILYEILAGRHPWRDRSPLDTVHAILHDDAPPIPATSLMQAELSAIAHKLLRKSAGARYPAAEAVLDALGSRETFQGFEAPTHVRPSLTSIAVLPFVFLSDGDERKALSLGFADALITQLGSLHDINVFPTSAILRYAPGADASQVCRDLGSRHVLQGNIQRVGARWRVSVQLFDAMTQGTTLSEKHDFELDDVFEAQDEIGRQVVGSLQRRFPTALKSRDRYSSDPEAYEAFLSGLSESYSDRLDTLRSAVRHLSSAVERDPEFALAHATLSYVAMHIHFEFDPQRSWLEKAEHHCQRALTLHPALPEAHFARAFILWSPAKNFQHAEAIAALEHVLAVQPNFERALNRMATICMHIGRLHEGRIAHDRAQRANPKTRNGNLEFFYLYGGDFVRGRAHAESWLRERPSNLYALVTCVISQFGTGDVDSAEKNLATALEQLPDEPMVAALQGILHARRHQIAPALDCVRRALECPRSFGHTHHTYYHVASVYALLADKGKAMAWLERSVETGFPCWPLFRSDPHLASLHGEPEFERLMTDLERKYTALTIQIARDPDS